MMWMDAWPRATDAPRLTREASADGSNEMGRVCIDRHNGAVNLLLMDWSARKVGLKALWTLKWHRTFNTAGPWTTAGGVWASDWPEWMRDLKAY
jgi:prepilin-type processing-associated H-X9-DG protein